MILIILIAAIALWGVIATIVDVHRDGYRRTPTDPHRVADLDPLQRAEPGPAYR